VCEASDIGPIVNALAMSQLTPTAVELQTHPARLLVRFESIEAAAEQQAVEAAAVVRGVCDAANVIGGADEALRWTAHARRPWQGDGAVLKVCVMPTEVGPTLKWLDETERHCDWEAVGRAAVGVLLVRVGGDVAQQAAAIAGLRARIPPGRGSVVVVRAGDELKRVVDVWGTGGDALPLMRAIKREFDPEGLLNPGRGPYGI
jgi:glycolate oxidase FAD binding subunit